MAKLGMLVKARVVSGFFLLFLFLFFFNFYILYINSRKKLRKTLKVKDSNKTNVIQYPIFVAHSEW